MTTKDFDLDRAVRDQALEEAARVAESGGAWQVGARIRARKGNPFEPATAPSVQRVLGNADVTD